MLLKKKVINSGSTKTVAKPMARVSFITRAKSVSEVEEFWSAMFYGRSGTGKTTLAASFPKDSLLLDFRDKGTNSIRNVKGIKVLEMINWDYVEGTYWDLKNTKHGYKTVIIDTIDGMQRLAMDQVKADNNKDESDALSQREWGEISGKVSQWMINFRDLPMNVVFLSQERIKNQADDENTSDYDEGQIEPEVGPALMPSIARSLNAAVNIIGNTYIKQTIKKEGVKSIRQTYFMLRIGPNPFYITKIRKPKEFVVPQAIANPTYEKLMKISKGEKI